MVSTTAHIFFWIVFGVFTLSSSWFFFLATRLPSHQREVHYITAAITTIAAIAYYTMAADYGTVPAGPRSFYYARYIDWTLTTPLLLLDLLLLAGADKVRITWTIFLDLIMIVTGLFGGLATDNYKWGYFVFGSVAYIGILYELLYPVRGLAATKSQALGKLFDQLAILTLVLWTIYPVVWILAEGTNSISLELEVGLYALMDMSAKAGFGFWLLHNRVRVEKSVEHVEAASEGLTAAPAV
ncbi:family A G protein-coupled receptor-like protein [Gonapodya prolifera JEL478]|uniref:Family A G protein-coupled receptor-like protein n=1 Tax=Gonapodya prolifera (strain JEL478) TaxID=1344416 RepID=A0A139AI58_GONPJ|nr:family A G protein-coupled receptor-like protein [Gonapodya prolifera JEL478]|eukprot:KXS16496.1 family A G protein-coupled receptor-like protein [Gonapodya prolifera JEL478]